MKDFIPMKLVEGTEPVKVKVGEVVSVLFDETGLTLPMKVISVYPNGDFDGEVEWYDA